MSKRDLNLFVFDIFVAIVKIENSASGFNNAQELLHNYTSWDSVIREFEIIGEASKYLLNENLLSSEHKAVVDFRNVIIHEYFGIDRDEVWDIIHNDLLEFKKTIINIIKEIQKKQQTELIESFIEDNSYLDFVVKALVDLR